MIEQPTGLYLITPPLAASAPFDSALAAALAAADVACVLLRFATDDPGARKQIVRDLAAVAQGAGAALLVDGDTRLAARAGADGAHISGAGEALDQALDSLKPDRIVGVDGLATRDACMVAGELDVDYLMFGGPHDDLSPEDVLDRAQWWAEIFNVPCVACAADLSQVDALARAGAEFVGLGDCVWNDPRGPAAAVADAAARSAGGIA